MTVVVAKGEFVVEMIMSVKGRIVEKRKSIGKKKMEGKRGCN